MTIDHRFTIFEAFQSIFAGFDSLKIGALVPAHQCDALYILALLFELISPSHLSGLLMTISTC